MLVVPTPLTADDGAFVGRPAELAALRRAVLGAASQGDVRIAVVAGEAGMGKTRLVTQALSTVEGVTVLAGACLNLGEASLPYGPIVAALRGTVGDPAVGGALEPGARAVLARLFPELGPHGDTPASLEFLNIGHTQLYEQLLRLLDVLAAERPVVLVVEDLHWSEPSTRDLLAFLVGNLRDVPVSLVLTYRSDEVGRGHPLRRLLGQVDRDPRSTHIQLGPLDEASLHQLVRNCCGGVIEPVEIDEIIVRSEGNPFFAQELVAAGPGVPPALEDVLLARVDALSPDAQTAVRHAAAAGREVAHHVLERLTGLPPDRLDAGLREAMDALILQVDGDGYRFRHALQQDAVHVSLLPGERVRLHAALAELLSADGALTPANAARLARHHELAHDLDRALHASFVAGVAATDAAAYADGARHFEKVLELWDRVADAERLIGTDLPEVLKKAALCAISNRDDQRGLAFAERALELLDPATQPERAAAVWMWIGHGRRHFGHDTAMEAYRRAVELAPPEPPTAVRAQVLAAYGAQRYLSGALTEGERLSREAVTVARAAGSARDESYALITLGSIRASHRSDAGGLEELETGRRLAVEHQRWDHVLRADVNISDALDILGRYDEAVARAREGIRLARHHGLFRSHGAFIQGNAVESLEKLGRFDDARPLAAELIILGTGTGNLLHGALGGAELALWDDDPDRAEELLQQAVALVDASPQPQWLARLAVCRARRAVIVRDAASAWDAAVLGLREGVEPEGTRIHDGQLIALALQAVQLGHPADWEWLAHLLDGEDRPMSPEDAAFRQLAAARVTGLRGPDDPSRWAAAAAAFGALGMAPLRALTLLDQARAHVVRGERDAAEVAWKEASVLARGTGSALLRRLEDDFARRAGFSRGDRADDPFALTPREREVLRLVAEGLSNREIGERLFITGKTASVHVSNILAKLEVPSRGQAAAIAHRHGLLD